MISSIAVLLSAVAAAETADAGQYNMSQFHYTYKGDDWVHLTVPEGSTNYCGRETQHQSPINLMKQIGSYGWAYGLPISKDKDNVKKEYTNLR